MNPKWLGFLIFVWLVGVFIGGTYELDMETSLTGTKTTMEYLFTPNAQTLEGTTGKTSWWGAKTWQTTDYWEEWLGVLTWDFPFLKAYDADSSGVIEADEQHNNDIGVYAGYFLHAFGLVGLVALLFAMFEFFSQFVPGAG